METLVKTEIEQEIALKYSDPNIGTPLPGNGGFRSTIERIMRIQMFPRSVVDDVKRINGGMKQLFGDVSVPVMEIAALITGIAKMSKTFKNPDVNLNNFNLSPEKLSEWLINPYVVGLDRDIDTFAKTLDKWSMFIDDPESEKVWVPITNFTIEDTAIEQHGYPNSSVCVEYETLCIKTKFNVKGYDQAIAIDFILGEYLPGQDIEQCIPRIKHEITSHFNSQGMFPGILNLRDLDNSLEKHKLGCIDDVLVPQFTFDAEEIIYNIIKENIVNSK